MSHVSYHHPLSEEQQKRSFLNLLPFAILQRVAMQKLGFPTPPVDWRPAQPPQTPASFGSDFKVPESSVRLLERVHAHYRDVRIHFFPEDHRYEILSVPTLGSVTELVNQLTKPFDADDAIDNMMNSSRWPRPEYTIPNGTPMSREEIKKSGVCMAQRVQILAHGLIT